MSLRPRQQYLDLDDLESPLLSASPDGLMLSGMPKSAIAERIFNDPHSWHGSVDDDDGDDDLCDPVVWLARELDNIRDMGSDNDMDVSVIESEPDVKLKRFSERFKLVPQTLAPSNPSNKPLMRWEGVQANDDPAYLPIFERSGLDLSVDLNLRLNSARESNKANLLAQFPSPVSFTPPLSPLGKSALARAKIQPLDFENEKENIVSPIPSSGMSASTTWSILELYGSRPNTPKLDSGRTLFSPYPATPAPPVPALPAYIHTESQNRSDSLTSMFTPPKGSERAPLKANLPTPIRKLPLIPDSGRSRTPTLTPSSSLPRIATPEPNRSVSMPLPSSLSEPASSLFSATPSPFQGRSASVRSPPLGPRPPSSATPKRPYLGRESSFFISPAPSRHRTPSSPKRRANNQRTI